MCGNDAPSLRTTKSAVMSAGATAPAFEATSPNAASAGSKLSALTVADAKQRRICRGGVGQIPPAPGRVGAGQGA